MAGVFLGVVLVMWVIKYNIMLLEVNMILFSCKYLDAK